MSKEELITAIAVCTDKQILNRIADVLNHKNTEPQKREVEARLIHQDEAARRLGVSRTTMWRLIKDGSIKTINVRGKHRVQLESLLKYAGVK